MVVQESNAETLTRAGGVWPSGTVNRRPAGLSLVSVQVTVACTAYNGFDIVGHIEGSNNGTSWVDAPDGTVTFSVNGSGFAGSTDQLVQVQQFKFYRFKVTETGGTVDGATVAFSLLGDYEQ